MATGKSCCVIGCSKYYAKGTRVHFYHFPADIEQRAQRIAAIGRKNFAPTKYTRLFSALLAQNEVILGLKSNDPLSPDYISSVFAHTKSPVKRKLVEDMHRFEGVLATKRRRAENNEQMAAAA